MDDKADESTSSGSEKNGAERADPLESTVGAIGRWQILLCSTITLSLLPVAWHQLGIIFLAPTTDFKCNNDEEVCSENCTGYEYDTTVFHRTMVMEWNLVCERNWMKDMHQSIFMLGVLIGNLVFGILGDRYGRRWPLLIALAFQAVSGIAASYSPNWYVFTSVRFLLALCNGGTMVIGFVVAMEIMGVKYRQIFGMIFHIPFILGHASLAGIAYATTDSWSTLQLWVSLPTTLLLLYYWIIPESPRWLITKGRTEEAVDILKRGARMNNMSTKDISEKINSIVDKTENSESNRNITNLFRTKNLRNRTLVLCYGWFSCGICFYGLSQYISHLSGDIFINVTISALIQLPGNVIALSMNHFLGRKKSQFGSFLIAGIFLVSISIIPQSWSTTTTILSLLGMIGISLAFPTIYLFSGEIFPTTLRNTGMGLCTVISRIGPMLSPFIADLYKHKSWLPPLIFGSMPLIAAATVLILPETQGEELPNTVQEADKLGNKHNYLKIKKEQYEM